MSLNNANVPHDQLGNAYEYLIRKFADDSGHTAQEFYTNRTVVHLMTQLAQLSSGESVYDPTCGSGGLLLNAVLELRNKKQEWRNVKVYGQEINLITSGIARMNMFLHDIEEFEIARGNTLEEPGLIDNGQLKTFDVVLANPPYSVKIWNQTRFAADPYGRNRYGTPPQGNADYAFLQHVIASLNENGRAAILFPHGILFRDSEAEMRRKILEADLIEGVIGLGPNLFYNSAMEACVLVLNRNKPEARKGRMVLVDGREQIEILRNHANLKDEHIHALLQAFQNPEAHAGLARNLSLEDVATNGHSLHMALYFKPTVDAKKRINVDEAIDTWRTSRAALKESVHALEAVLQGNSHV